MTNQMIFPEDERAAWAPAPARETDERPDDPNGFRLDAYSRAVGRIGIAAARKALADAVQRAATRDEKLAA